MVFDTHLKIEMQGLFNLMNTTEIFWTSRTFLKPEVTTVLLSLIGNDLQIISAILTQQNETCATIFYIIYCKCITYASENFFTFVITPTKAYNVSFPNS